MQLNHDDYRAIKRMNKKQLTAYLNRILQSGYDAGIKAMTIKAKKPGTDSDATDQKPGEPSNG